MDQQEKLPFALDENSFRDLLTRLVSDGYTLIGPQYDSGGAMVYKEFKSFDQLPRGMKDTQSPGHYRVEAGDKKSLFSQFTSGPHSAKNFLFPSLQKLFHIEKSKNKNQAPRIVPQKTSEQKFAFIGLRACEIAAIKIQDKVFDGPAAAFYQNRRENTFIIGVECTSNVSTCFCVDMNTGPRIKDGADLSLVEYENDGHYSWSLKVGSEKAKNLLKKIKLPELTLKDFEKSEKLLDQNIEALKGRFKNVDIKRLLYENYNSEQWDDLATRCLACANCTMVCPTCFCSTVEDTQDLKGENAERWLKWESCFSAEHSQMHGSPVRDSIKSRYRQWLTHKFSAWQDQFGSSGCTGCGKCVTWCPVGIDVRQEISIIKEKETL